MDIRKKLKEVLDAFPDFKYHPDFIDDLSDILDNSGKIDAFAGKFFTALVNLSNYKETTHKVLYTNFEQLKQVDNMYSMHVKVKNCNARVLYSFLSDGTVLLHCFYERGGKKNTDYTKALKIAEIRRTELTKEVSQ